MSYAKFTAVMTSSIALKQDWQSNFLFCLSCCWQNFCINMVMQVFHGFVESGLIHEHVKVVFKVALCLFIELSIHLDV